MDPSPWPLQPLYARDLGGGSRCTCPGLQIQQQTASVVTRTKDPLALASAALIIPWFQFRLIYAFPHSTSSASQNSKKRSLCFSLHQTGPKPMYTDILKLLEDDTCLFPPTGQTCCLRTSILSCFSVTSFNSMAVEAQVLRDRGIYEPLPERSYLEILHCLVCNQDLTRTWALLKAYLRSGPPLQRPVLALDLNLILSAPQKTPFDSIGKIPLDFPCLVGFLVAIISDRHAILHNDEIVLRPRPLFFPKVVSVFHLHEGLVLPLLCPASKHQEETALFLDIVWAISLTSKQQLILWGRRASYLSYPQDLARDILLPSPILLKVLQGGWSNILKMQLWSLAYLSLGAFGPLAEIYLPSFCAQIRGILTCL